MRGSWLPSRSPTATLPRATAVWRRLLGLLARHPGQMRTITADNGTEFHWYGQVEAVSPVKFYFATGKADLATGAESALAEVAKGVASGKRAVVSGFTDATGDPARNDELAKARAAAVSGALATAGVAADKIDMKKPEAVTGSGSNAEARRVEVALN